MGNVTTISCNEKCVNEGNETEFCSSFCSCYVSCVNSGNTPLSCYNNCSNPDSNQELIRQSNSAN